LTLGRREPGALFGDALRIYFANFWRFLAIGAAVVVPTQLIVSGIGLGRLSGGYETKQRVGEQLIGGAVQTLVASPLIVAMCVYMLLDIAGEKPPSLRRAMQSGLDAFAQIFLPVLAAVACEAAIALAVLLPAVGLGVPGLTILLIGVLFLAVRWYFIAQAVVVDGAHGLDALRASWDLTRGFGLRVVGVVVLGYIAFGLGAALLASPITAVARAADSSALLLASEIVTASLGAPAIALLSALLYFDLKARRTSPYA
jgi:hypothetical protein